MSLVHIIFSHHSVIHHWLYWEVFSLSFTSRNRWCTPSYELSLIYLNANISLSFLFCRPTSSLLFSLSKLQKTSNVSIIAFFPLSFPTFTFINRIMILYQRFSFLWLFHKVALPCLMFLSLFSVLSSSLTRRRFSSSSLSPSCSSTSLSSL